MTLDEHFALIGAEWQASLAAPLSVRKALLVAVLLDHFPDRVFMALREQRPELMDGAADLPAWRAQLVERSAALAAVFALGSGAAVLRLEAVELASEDYPGLPVEDFMVSLYNGNSVQRAVIALAEGGVLPAHVAIGAAVAFWDGAGWR